MNITKEGKVIPRSKQTAVKDIPLGKKEISDTQNQKINQVQGENLKGVNGVSNHGSMVTNDVHQTMVEHKTDIVIKADSHTEPGPGPELKPKTKSNDTTQTSTLPQPQTQVTPTTITISGEVFLDKLPPQIELSNQMYSKVNTGLGFQTYRSVMVANQLCGVCGDKDEDDHEDLLIHNPCKHWSHIGCVINKGERKPCPICNPKNRPIDYGQNENYTSKLELRNGKIGYTTPLNSSYKQTKMSEIFEKIGPDRRLNFGGNIDGFMSNPYVSVDDYFSSGKNIIDIQRLTGVTTVFELEKKGLGFAHICNKKFSVDVDIMMGLGIDRSYFREKLKSKLWPLPQIKLKGKNVLMTVHPLEYMDRKGFKREDFMKLGWTSKRTFIEDGSSVELAEYVFRGR